MLTDILINIPLEDRSAPVVACGLSLAKSLKTHVTGVAFGIEPVPPVSYFGAMPVGVLEEVRAMAEKSARDAADGFTRSAQGLGVDADALPFVASFDRSLSSFARMSRLHDLTVVAQPNPDKPGGEIEFLETALFDSGRGILVVPYIQKSPIELNRVMVAWDGGRAAARAVAEARPLLARAKEVQVLVVETGKPDPREVPGADLARHLARHDLKVELRRVYASSTDLVDETILNAVTEDGIDLVVMGGYGHSRLRQFVLGGVTRSIIESMTAPVLMAH